jgi:hypothetical protein
MKNFFRIAVKTLLWTVGILLSLLVILEIVLSTKVPTMIVNKIAAEYVDGEIHFGKISASMFRRFPATTLTLEDFHITYPADRFDKIEKEGVQGHLMYKGCSETADTLASFKRFSVGVNVPALLGGTVSVPYMRLDCPRIFAHSYSDGSANWDMFITGPTEEEEDTTETGALPKISIGRVMMTGKPHIVYTDSRDTIFAMINMKRLMLNGKIKSDNIRRSRIGLTLDSMFVAGRLGRDTIATGLDRLYLHENGRNVDVDAAARAFLATSSFGRLKIPVSINGTLSFPEEDVPAVSTRNLAINILDIPINVEADVKFADAMDIAAKAVIPHATLTHPDFPGQALNLSMDVKAGTDDAGKLNVNLGKLRAGIKGLNLSLKADVADALGEDPFITADGNLAADIDSLVRFLPDTLGIEATGKLNATINGSALLSQLDIYNFSKSSLTGEVNGDSISVKMAKDTLDATIKGLKIVLGPEEKESRRDSSKTFKLIGITGELASAEISYKDDIELKASRFMMSAKNIMDDENEADTTKKIHPFSGRVTAGRLMFRDSEGTMIMLSESNNSFNVFPKKGQLKIPVLALTSRNGRIFLRSGVNRAFVTDANIKASAAMNTVERRQKMRAMRDSLAKVYPDIPKDSLFIHMMSKRASQQTRELPEWLKEEDFRKQDIDISLDKSMSKYFRDWDLKGQFTVSSGSVMTPYFPLRNTLNGFDLNFTNDKVEINEFRIKSGDSDIAASGKLTGLKNALLGRRGTTLKLHADIISDKINANQLLSAYNSGANFNPEELEGKEDISDEEYMDHIVLDTTATAEGPSLIVVPANINADIALNLSDISYSDLLINSATADLTMKERCVQITNTKALTNMGNINLEGFYSTKSKTNLKAGFSITFEDITAEKVINLMPSIDTIMPLLKSFGGNLNCELAATAQLDTNMNFIMPSINGIMRIGGEDLSIKNSDMFRKMAKLLIFKNKKEGHIDKMTVEGVIKDSKVEIFPFILEIDRYMLGLSGVQNMDMSYRYHASLIRSPFLIKLGMDIYGPDFDNMKFKIGKAKYKNRNVPVFSAVIDDTKVNLIESIRNIFDKGVDAVIDENRKMSAIEKHKKDIGYIQAVDQKLEELSADEQKQFEAEQEALNNPEAATDSLSTTAVPALAVQQEQKQ